MLLKNLPYNKDMPNTPSIRHTPPPVLPGIPMPAAQKAIIQPQFASVFAADKTAFSPVAPLVSAEPLAFFQKALPTFEAAFPGKETVPLKEVAAFYQDAFAERPEVVAALKEHPVGFAFHSLLSGAYLEKAELSPEDYQTLKQDNAFYLAEAQDVLVHLLKSSGQTLNLTENTPYSAEVHTAFTYFMQRFSEPLPSLEPLALPKSDLSTLEQGARIEAVSDEWAHSGLAKPFSQALLAGVAHLPEHIRTERLELLLRPEIRDVLVPVLKDLETLYTSGQLQNTTLEELGETLFTHAQLDHLTEAADAKDFWDHSLHLPDNLKARLITFVTLNEAGEAYSEIARAVREGDINVYIEESDDSYASYLGSKVTEDLNDAFFIDHKERCFRHTELADLFGHNNYARQLRSLVIHEAVHALDDVHRHTGIRANGVHIDADPHPEPHKQNSLESEFNAYYAQVVYMAQELSERGQYDKGALLAALGEYYPDQGLLIQHLSDFIHDHDIAGQQPSEQVLQTLYEEVESLLISEYAYESNLRERDGLTATQRYLEDEKVDPIKSLLTP